MLASQAQGTARRRQEQGADTTGTSRGRWCVRGAVDAGLGVQRARVRGWTDGSGSVVKCRRTAERYGERLDQAMQPSHGRVC
jgi:hypothetical protein